MDDPRQIALQLAQTLKARAQYQGRTRVVAATGWDELRAQAMECRRCGLCETRNSVVFGEGSENAELMFIGEAPGFEEDRQGRPFVGKAGELLTRMIENGMGLKREEVYIANVLKCRPPQNRDPAADEVEQCRPWLLAQIEHIQPKVICTLGRHALRALTGYEGGISRARGRAMPFAGTHVLPTFHPAYLLRNPAAKREAWEDLKTVLRMLGRPVPARR
ncbi:MAG: uracil-DNA glycosylase [Planctomycetota bacterium]